MQIPSFVLSHSNIKDEKIWHFYVLLAGWASIYTVMNTSVILFLNEALGNIFLAGLALSIGSLFSLMFDGVFSYLQKIFQSRMLFMTSIVGMIIAVFFFLISFHPLLAFLAAIFFRISFDLCDITAMSYILARSLPAEYGQNLSYKQLAQGVGMIGGFVISAILLGASYFIGDTAVAIVDGAAELINVQAQSASFISALFLMKIFLILLLFGLLFFTFILFDTNAKITKETLIHSFQKLESNTIGGLKQASTQVTKDVSGKLESQPNQIQLQTTQAKQSFSFKEIFGEVLSAAKNIFLIFKKKPSNTSLLWSMGVMGIFSYWDTFLATFLPIFFTEVLRSQSSWIANVPGSLLMLFFILPVLGLLPIVAKWGDKYGRHYFMIFGLFLTAISAFIIALTPYTALLFIIIAGFGIAFGYLFGMSTAKAQVASKMNEFIAVENNKEKIDSNASAGPMMLIDNVGNIIGPLIGGGMIALFGFKGFFFIFALILAGILFLTEKKYAKISGHSYVFQSPLKSFEVQSPVKEVQKQNLEN